MDSRNIRRNLYRVLRQTGVPRERIFEDASFTMDMMMDDIDMTCFLFYLETKFNVDIDNESLPRINTVQSTIDYLQQCCA